MSDKKPVIVYGVSGYTGRLVCEYLREFNIPFIAAGRDAARIQEVLDKIPGLDTVDHEVVEVEHTVEALTELFTGAQVVSNMVGPFIKLGGTVVEAALNAGCHYMDTTGEQDWVLDVQEKFGDKYQEKGLLLSPGIAQMYTTGEIAANIALETPGLDTLDILVLWKGFPTYASTQTIFTILKANWYYLEQNKYVQWAPGTDLRRRCSGTARNGPRVAVGRHLPSGVVQERSASLQRQGCGWRVRPLRDGRCCRDTEDGGGADQDPARRSAGGRAGGDRRFGAGGHAAAGKPAHQHVAGLGVRVGSAGSCARRHPRKLQLQADGPPAGVRSALAAAAAAQADRAWRRRARRSATANCSVRYVVSVWCWSRKSPSTPRSSPSRFCPEEAPRLMRLTDYLDKGASLGSTAPCLTMGERTLSYGDVQQFSRRVRGFARGLGDRRGRQGGHPVRQ